MGTPRAMRPAPILLGAGRDRSDGYQRGEPAHVGVLDRDHLAGVAPAATDQGGARRRPGVSGPRIGDGCRRPGSVRVIAPEVRDDILTVVMRCDDLARLAMDLRHELIDDDEGLGWVLRLQDRMAAVRIEAAALLDDEPAPPWWVTTKWGTPADGGR